MVVTNLLICDPNPVIQLLHVHINHNYFEFNEFIFQQIHGTAMGAAFSPTIANIFMSVFLRKFLQIQKKQPILLKRYIDEALNKFNSNLNNFHEKIQFTTTNSDSSVNFLDLTIFKGNDFQTTGILDIKTYEKPQNLYQYLEFSSIHPSTINQRTPQMYHMPTV